MAKPGETLATVDRVLSILDKLGRWGPIAATFIFGGIGSAWSAMTSLPGPVIAMCGLFSAAGGLWLYNGFFEIRQRRKISEERPDYEAWDHVEILEFSQAANLWAECEPSGGVKRKAYPYLRMLKEQAIARLIEATLDYGEYTMDSTTSRAELRKLAEAKGMRPKFLYPEKR